MSEERLERIKKLGTIECDACREWFANPRLMGFTVDQLQRLWKFIKIRDITFETVMQLLEDSQ